MQRFQQTRRALGSEVILTLIPHGDTDATALLAELWQTISLFEATFSRFQPDSELTYVNERAGDRTPISPEFRALITTAKQFAVETNGLYNPFILPELQTAGYLGSWPHPSERGTAPDFRSRRVATIDQLEIGDDWLLLPTQSALDFGGIGKGYLLDELGDHLAQVSLRGYWLSLGGDILCWGRDIDDRPWQIGLQHATDGTTAATVTNHDGQRLAVATSGTTKRQGTGWHHLIDPRTGLPADTSIKTASVVHAQATAADVYAKCLVIGGQAQLKAFTEQHGLESVFVQSVDSRGTIVEQYYQGAIEPV